MHLGRGSMCSLAKGIEYLEPFTCIFSFALKHISMCTSNQHLFRTVGPRSVRARLCLGRHTDLCRLGARMGACQLLGLPGGLPAHGLSHNAS